MGLQKMTVCAKGDWTSGTAELPYQFYATGGTDGIKVVNIVMPVGGAETGFFRYPRVGESVLVDDDGAKSNPSYYLMGYLPSAGTADNNFLTSAKTDTEQFKMETDTLLDGKGMAIRYRQTGKIKPDAVDGGDRYSEIGFYHRRTHWKASGESDYRDFEGGESDEEYGRRLRDAGLPPRTPYETLKEYVEKLTRYHDNWSEPEGGESFESYRTRLERAGLAGSEPGETFDDYKARVKRYHDNWVKRENKGYPKIDHINIHSTGDIHESALNHHRTEAKRFELLVDCEDEAEPSQYEKNHPFGDRSGDDSTLYAGDAHIRAKNRIVIRAGESIELRAGRSSIIINDEGITIASRKNQANVFNSWDTVLALKASKGVTLFGQHVTIKGGIDYTLAEGYGGSISSRLGITRINGFDIRAETINTFNYLARGLGNGLDYLLNAGTLISGAAGAGSGVGKSTGYLTTSPALNFFASKGSTGMAGGLDFKGFILGLLDILLLVLMVVEIALDMAIPKVHKRDKHGRDGLYTALALIEYGLILECFRELCSPSLPYGIFEASLHLTSKAGVLLDGHDSLFSIKTKATANSPLSGSSTKTLKEAYKGGFTRFKDKLVQALSAPKIIAGGVGGLVVGAGLVTGMVLSGKQNKELEEELRSL